LLGDYNLNRMKNQELAKLLRMMALYLEMKDVKFKPQAYEKAAYSIEALNEDIEEFIRKRGKEGLKELPGIGESIADKIIEFLKTGKIKELEEFKKEVPVDIETLSLIEGIGPKTIYKLYKSLNIKNLEDLEKACREHKIRRLPGFGALSEEKILKGIEFYKKGGGRFLLGFAMPLVEELLDYLRKCEYIDKLKAAGSYRRRKETIGDVDILATSKKPEKVMDYFVKFPEIDYVYAKGPTKTMVRLKIGLDVDIRVVSEESFGAALAYFTGSKDHNIKLREIAMKKNWKLNEYGLFDKNEKMIAGKTEEEIYEKLNMQFIPPEMRENRGEIELALENKLPKIIGYEDIKGDLHCHVKWKEKDGGSNTIEEMAEIAQKMGYEYLGIASHTKFLKIEHGLDEKDLELRDKDIDKINQKLENQGLKFKILKGCEANILNDGSIDIDDETLKKLDFVIAGVHSNFKMPKEKMTERIIKAMKNPNVDIISHPTGRIIQRRDEYQIDFEKILKAAKETNTILEINSYPDRLDLNDINIKQAKEIGVKMVINTDSHNKDHMKFIELGIAQARRGWAEKEDIINCWPLEKLLKFFKK
jgi:DNA polymerase (family 10)